MRSSKARFWGVRGDHDHALAFGTASNCSEDLSRISNISREWGECFLTGEEVGFLRRLPLDRDFTIDGIDFEIAHGSDPYNYVFYNMIIGADGEQKDPVVHQENGEKRRFILAGHSHKPFVKNTGKTTILNPGSVGQPRDHDPRASYGVIENGGGSIDAGNAAQGLPARHRVDFQDVGRAVACGQQVDACQWGAHRAGGINGEPLFGGR